MSTAEKSADVVVIGGGVIGLSIAWRACMRGMRALVLEAGEIAHGASRHAAGMIAPVAEVAPGEERLLGLARRSAEIYPEFIAALAADCGREHVGYTRCGTLMVARDRDEAEALERERALRERLGIPVAPLAPSEARRREPGLAPTLRLALDLPDDHAVDPRTLCSALATAIVRRGGAIREHSPAVALQPGAVRVSRGTRVRAGATVIATGALGGGLAGVGEPVPSRPVKGQIMRLHDPEGPGLVTRVIRFPPTYVVPRGDGRYVIGGTSEERGLDTTVTAGAALSLLREAAELVPGIGELVLDEFTAGTRPGTPDNLPAIGPASVERVWWATGHYRGGVMLAPVTAELLVAALCGEPVDPLLAPCDPSRFWGAAA
ncbi:MAG TPA: glycine oxidase ThiO [Solirubrobacteraceae bacterium]|nr:glycine oxidase ThiO [Solirubrobacteraceae bacterium]